MSYRQEYPYNEGGVFRLGTVYWRQNLLGFELNFEHDQLPSEYNHATGQSFWDEVSRTIRLACPGSEQYSGCHSDYDMIFIIGVKTLSEFQLQACKAKQMLEERAEQTWLRPGVPKLYSLVTDYLKEQGNLVLSLIEFQRKYGYLETRQLVAEFSECILL